MDIICKTKRNNSFKTIVAGEVFRYEGCFYMRIETVANSVGMSYNAVYLDGGDLASFKADDTIELVDAQLIIS